MNKTIPPLTQLVKLTNGEDISIDLMSVCFPKQVFSRMGPSLVAGVVQDPTWKAVYVWQEKDGVYIYAGDITFHDEGEGAIKWNIFPHVSSHSPERAEEHILAELKQKNNLRDGGVRGGNTISLLSIN